MSIVDDDDDDDDQETYSKAVAGCIELTQLCVTLCVTSCVNYVSHYVSYYISVMCHIMSQLCVAFFSKYVSPGEAEYITLLDKLSRTDTIKVLT